MSNSELQTKFKHNISEDDGVKAKYKFNNESYLVVRHKANLMVTNL